MRVLQALSLALVCVSCGQAPKGPSIKLKGSDTVLPIGQRLAEEYKKQPDASRVSVTGGGSGVGIAALLEGTTDIAMSSREMKLSERLKLINANHPFKKEVVAYDALALVVHPSNPVTQLTREQLEGMFTGAIRNWKEVGGPDLNVQAYSRESSSGTHEFFKEAVLDGREFYPAVAMMPATGAIITSIGQTQGAIGYVGLAYLDPAVKALAVSYDGGKTFVQPSTANAQNGTYPIVRPLYFIYLEQDSTALAPFLSFVFSSGGQQYVSEEGFIPVPARGVSLDKSREQASAAPDSLHASPSKP